MLAKIYEQNPSEKELQRVVDALERDEIIIYPTDSVYAFGCSLRSPKAIERLRRIRGKSEEKFTVVFENIAQVAEYCRVDNAVFRILKRNLPGPCWRLRRAFRTRRSNGAARSASAFRPAPSRGPWSGRWGVR